MPLCENELATGTRLVLLKDAFCEHYLHELCSHYRCDLCEKKLLKGTEVSFLTYINNLFGTYLRVTDGQQTYDLKRDAVQRIS